MIHQANKITALLTAFFFFVTQFGPVSEGFAYTPTAAVSEVDIPSSFQVTLPPDFGTIESLLAGSGPAILHIQEAHGSPRVQKRIESIIHYLVSEYGVKLILLEGSASKLDPNLARFFPENLLNENLFLVRKKLHLPYLACNQSFSFSKLFPVLILPYPIIFPPLFFFQAL